MKKLFSIIISAILLTGCATVFTGTNQSVNVRAVDSETKTALSDVSCSVVDSNGATFGVDSNPGEVTVSKGKGPLQVQCDQNGYQHYNGAIASDFNAVSILNVFFWPGFIVDVATGAIQKYPASYTAQMRPKA